MTRLLRGDFCLNVANTYNDCIYLYLYLYMGFQCFVSVALLVSVSLAMTSSLIESPSKRPTFNRPLPYIQSKIALEEHATTDLSQPSTTNPPVEGGLGKLRFYANMLPVITLEEHFISEGFSYSTASNEAVLDRFPPKVAADLCSLGDRRLGDMNQGDVTLQVISHVPASGVPLDVCQKANNELSGAVRNNAKRFAGFAMLPMSDPTAASDELTRCIKELNFVGALVPNHTNGRYYDDAYFWPVFERAERLNVPIYLHPTSPHQDWSLIMKEIMHTQQLMFWYFMDSAGIRRRVFMF